MSKEEIAHDEQFLHLPQCFQLNLITMISIKEIFNSLILMAATYLLYVGKDPTYYNYAADDFEDIMSKI